MSKNLLKIKNLKFKILLTIVMSGALIRFYNINWGAPFYFHPDERNIASSVSQLQFPNQLNPHFFAYGSLPIYIIYLFGVVFNFLSVLINQSSRLSLPVSIFSVPFENAIVISRLLSAFLSTALIPLVYFTGKKLKDEKTGLLAAFFVAASIGLVQFAHFGTFEMWLTFFTTLLFYLCLKITEKDSIKNVFICGIVLGILVSVKISSLAIAPIPFLSIILRGLTKQTRKGENLKYINMPFVKKVFIESLIMAITAMAIIVVTSPFAILDHSSFLSSMNYESSVVLGTLPVFYTGEFYRTAPILFQFTKIYPFILNPFMTIIFIPSLIYVSYASYKKRNVFIYLLLGIYCLLFFSQAFFFAKWIRYMVPAIVFMYLITAVAMVDFFSHFLKKPNNRYYISNILAVLWIGVIVLNIIYALSYAITAYVQPDTRIKASDWARKYIPNNARIVSEAYDLGITAFNPYFPNITLFNFYDLDSLNPINSSYGRSHILSKTEELKGMVYQADYIILPSQRIMHTRLTNKKRFPHGYKFYKSLFNGALGFKKIYQTSCDLFCKITYLGDPIFKLEETSSVFDRPTVFIFKRNI